jgi:hypothetical protein
MSNRFLITQTLLSSWQWVYKLDDGYQDFLDTLNKKPIHQTKAMLEGIRFENVLNAVLSGANIDPSHEWYEPIMELKPTLEGAQQQVKVSRDIQVNGLNFVVYGVLDFLKAGIIYDSKYSKTYHAGKYLDSPQHPSYFFIVPEAYEFQYKICDGTYIYTETYRPDEVDPIERTIGHFMDFLDRQNLVDTYTENWLSKY